jgi:uncharacterized protein YqeY
MEYFIPYVASTPLALERRMDLTTAPNGDAGAMMKLRLRGDLRVAMAGKKAADVAVLRTMLGALDQAEAVAVTERGAGCASLPFGDPAVEVPRKRLSAEDVGAVIRKEHDELRGAADDYARLGQAEAAAAFAHKAEVLGRYLAAA